MSIVKDSIVKRKDLVSSKTYQVNTIFDKDVYNESGKQICFIGDSIITNTSDKNDVVTINISLLEKIV